MTAIPGVPPNVSGAARRPAPMSSDPPPMQLDWSDMRPGGYRDSPRPPARLAPAAPWWRIVWAQLVRGTLSRIERRRARLCVLCGGRDDESLHEHTEHWIDSLEWVHQQVRENQVRARRPTPTIIPSSGKAVSL